MQKVFDAIFKVLENVAAVVLFVVTAVAFYQLVARYFFSSSNAGIDELTRLAFVWCASLGSALAFRAGAHLGVTALVNKLKDSRRVYYEIFLNLLLIAFMVLVVKAGIQMAQMGGRQFSEYLRMSMACFYSCIPVGAAFSIVVFIENIVHISKRLASHKKGEETN